MFWHSQNIWPLIKPQKGWKLVKSNSVQCWILTDDVAFHMLQSRMEGFLLHLSHNSSFLSEQKVVQTLHNWDQIVYEVDNFFIDLQFNKIFLSSQNFSFEFCCGYETVSSKSVSLHSAFVQFMCKNSWLLPWLHCV